jgi:hypothetical protein
MSSRSPRLRGGLLVASLVVGVALAAPVPSSLAVLTASDTSTASAASDTLAPPTDLTATGGGSTIDLSWTPTVDTYATGYTVYRAATSGGSYTSIGSVTPRTATSRSDAPGNGTWYYVLRSVYQQWESALSNEASATISTTTSTGFVGCEGGDDAAETSNAGDDNGYESNPSRACADDGSNATDSSTGTGGNASCGTGATPDTRKDQHRFWGFDLGLPGSVTSIDGIRVLADVGMSNNGGTSSVCVQLSWDGGTTWTSIQSQSMTTTSVTTYTFGSTSDTWGRAWTIGELSPANLRVRVIDATSQNNKQYRLDYLAVDVTYSP